MTRIKATLIGLALIASSIVGMVAAAPPAGAIVCNPYEFLGSSDLGWHDGIQSVAHGALDYWCNANGDDYGNLHYNFDLYPRDGSRSFSEYDTWMDWHDSAVTGFQNNLIEVSGSGSHSVVLDRNLATYDYTWSGSPPYAYQRGSVRWGCLPEQGFCYAWNYANESGPGGWWAMYIHF